MEPENNHEKLAGTLVAFAGGIAGVGFVVSALYDLGYYTELGYPLSELPTTFSDHVRSCIDWFPLILMVLSGYLVTSLFKMKIQKGKTDEEIIDASPNPLKSLKTRDNIFKFFFYVQCVLLILAVIYGARFKGIVPIASATVWIGFAAWCLNNPRIFARHGTGFMVLLALAPALAFFLYFMARNIAYADLRKDSNLTTITMNSGKEFKTNVLRSLENGLLVHDSEANTVMFITHSAIASIQRPVDLTVNGGLLKFLKGLKPDALVPTPDTSASQAPPPTE